MATRQSDLLFRIIEEERSSQAPDDPETEAPKKPLQGAELLHSVIEQGGGVPLRRQAEPDIGFTGAVGEGIKSGVLEPLTFLTGARPEDERIDETSEKVGFVLGEFAGLGLSFVPFAGGTGLAMRGLGLAGKIRRGGPLWNFTRNTIGGALQFGGISEDLEDIPKNVAMGAAFGGAIEGIFLGWAMKNRGAAASTRKLFDNGSPIGDQPADFGVLKQEIAVAPNAAKTLGRLETELTIMARENGNVPQALAGLVGRQESTVLLPESGNISEVLSSVKQQFPEAQVLQREGEVLIHNPAIPEGRLTSKQAAQYQSNGVFEGLEGIFSNKSYEFTGVPVAEGRVQLRDPDNPGRVFAPLREEVSIPTTPRVFGMGEALNMQRLQGALNAGRNSIGFALRGEGGDLTRGFVDITDYLTTPSVRAFVRDNMDTAQQLGVDPSTREGLAALAEARGVRGLLIQDEGIPIELRVFDQETVTRTDQVPSLFQHADEAITGPEGELFALEPSWRNRAIESLRQAGFDNKEMGELMSLHSRTVQRGLDDLPEDEFIAMRRQAEAQFFEGCL